MDIMHMPHAPTWWPHWLNFSRETVIGVAGGLIIGISGVWYYFVPPAPFMKFEMFSASYDKRAQSIVITGVYKVRQKCKESVIWRTEAIASSGQIVRYAAPYQESPNLERGQHEYQDFISLRDTPTRSAEWVVRVIATCPGVQSETIVSSPAIVTTVHDIR